MRANGIPSNGHHYDPSVPIAIVGMGGRFPGDATNPERLWEMIFQGRNALSEVPKDRFNIDAFHHPNAQRRGTTINRGGHFMKGDIAKFDAPFFSITANEAHAMDPQQRLALEVAYETLENAGIRIEDVAGTEMACYIAAFTRDYQVMRSHDPYDVPLYEATGSGTALLSNRISWFFDLKGPSISLDTACSSSLVALHLACQSIRSGETTSALVGGTNLILMPELQCSMSNFHFLSADSRSKAFDHKADGYSRGEGVSFVVVKRLEDAIKDNNVIRAVIRATGINQDGRTPGITLPSAKAQEDLIRSTYELAGLDFETTAYVEAHGTGTAAGDPLECLAIAHSLGRVRSKENPLLVGSIKTNVGHMGGASGLTGLIKAVYCVEKGQIPPTLWFEKPNPRIPLDDWNLKIPTELSPWPNSGLRRASIDSMGIGGTNAHCVIDDAFHYLQLRNLHGTHNTEIPESKTVNGLVTGLVNGNGKHQDLIQDNILPRLYLWTSHDRAGSQRLAKSLNEHIQKDACHNESYLARLAFVLSRHRSRLPWKSFVVASNRDELSKALSGNLPEPIRSSQVPNIGFIFTGQGAQWHAMGRELMTYPIFRTSLEEASKEFKSLGCGWDLITEMYSTKAKSRIHEPEISQPACIALQVALVDLLRTFNIKPSKVVGHSSGEIAAAYAKGAISRESAWAIAYHRGRLSSSLTQPGAMLAAGVSQEDALPIIQCIRSGEVVVACVNSPSNITISGDESAVTEVETKMQEKGIFNRRLMVRSAYHSHHMRSLAEEYLKALEGLECLPGYSDVQMFSSLTGGLVDAPTLGAPQYWVSNMTEPVLFTKAVEAALTYEPSRRKAKARLGLLVELGPHSALQGPLREIMAASKEVADAIPYVSILKRGQSAYETFLTAMGTLVQRGVAADIEKANNPLDEPQGPIPPDLPPYPWNHETSYWYEPPATRAFRHREHPRHDLLGARSEYSSPLEPSWINYLRISEVPWVEDHTIQSAILYPFAGMVVMAIEATRQVADTTKEIEGFQLRDITAGAAMVVPPDEALETKLQLRPWRTGSRVMDGFWNEFTISSRNHHGVWTFHCSGLISVRYKVSANEDFVSEDLAVTQRYKDEYLRISGAGYKTEISWEWYALMAEVGFHFGPTFKTLTHISSGDYEAHCIAEIPDTRAAMPENAEYPHVIHPATLDSVLQMMLHSCTPAGVQLDSAVVPNFAESIYVSAKVSTQPGSKLHGYSRASSAGVNEKIHSAVASDCEWYEPLVIVENCRTVTVEALSRSGTESQSKSLRQLGSVPLWDIDIETTPLETLTSFFQSFAETVPNEDPQVIQDLEHATIIFCKRVLQNFSPSDAEKFQPHHRLFYEYMQHQYDLAAKKSLLCQPQDVDWLNTPEAIEEEVLNRVAASGIDGQVLCHIGAVFDKIFLGEVTPLEVLREDNLLTKFYHDALGMDKISAVLAKFVHTLSHKKPLRILEVGGGTGGTTRVILSSLGNSDQASGRLLLYTFTDISGGFFEGAQAEFQEWASFMEYKMFDVEKDPAQQGFMTGVYDLVVCHNVLHATSSMATTLGNCKKLLAPYVTVTNHHELGGEGLTRRIRDGQLLMCEMTTSLARTAMIFGTLPGWWLGENDGRKWGPTMSESEWDARLRDQGYTGLDFCFHDYKADHQFLSLMVSSPANGPSHQKLGHLIFVTSGKKEESVDSVMSKFSQTLGKECPNIDQVSLSNVSSLDLSGKTVVSFVEANEPLLNKVDHDDFKAMKHLILQSKQTLWLTKGTCIEITCPEGSLVAGLSRSIRGETPAQLVLLDLDPSMPVDSQSTQEAIIRVLKATAEKGVDNGEFDYAARGSFINIARLYPDPAIDEVFRSHDPKKPQMVPLKDSSGCALALSVQTPGMLDTLRFIDDEESGKELGDNEIEIEVKAVGLNFMDVMISMGQIPDTGLGVECSGLITRTGKNVQGHRVGDRVATFRPGSYRTYIRNDERMFVKVPRSMTFEEAASIPCVFSTAYYSLVEVARLKQGESVLIHAAAGGLGQAAIMLSQHLGAEIFVTTSSASKKQFLMEKYNIAGSRIFRSRDHSFALGVKRMTGGKGVDVVLNSLAGEALRQTWLCVSPLGRFVELGKKDITGNTGLDMSPFLNNVSFSGVNMVSLYQTSIGLYGQILDRVMKLFENGVARVIDPIQVMSFTHIEEAFRIMQRGKHIGKIVFKVADDDIVSALPPSSSSHKLRPDATYLLPGGLGGLGRSLGRSMVQHGARHLVFTSRSSGKRIEARQLLEDLEEQGVQVKSFACDISDPAELRKLLDEIKVELPPVRGVVNLAMQLQDVMFENMTVDHLRAALRPKFHITQNLHNFLPKDLDFFICLSSISSIVGMRGQANYNAGNAYEDAIAHYRRSQGLKGTSINLGAISGVGWVAELDDVLPYVRDGHVLNTREQEFLDLMHAAMADRVPTQTVIGVATGGSLKDNSGRGEPPYWFKECRFNPIRAYGTQNQGRQVLNAHDDNNFATALVEAKTMSEATKAVTSALTAKLAKTMITKLQDIDPGRSVTSYGVDSLVAVEIRTWAFKELKSDVSIFEILGNAPLSALADKIASKSTLLPSGLLANGES